MARAFLYDLGTIDKTIEDGVMGGAANYTFTPGDEFDYEYLLNDQGIVLDATVANLDAIRIDFGSSITPTVCCVYVDENSGVGGVRICRSANNGETATTSVTTKELVVGWNIIDLTGSNQYWFVKFEDALDIGEIFFGFKYEFGYTPDKGEIDDAEYGITDLQSYGGNEYSNRRHGKKDLFGWDWRFIDNTMKTALKTFKNQVEGTRLKFLYYDDSDYNWVKLLPGSLKFKKMGYQVWETSIRMRGQLT